MEYLPSHVKTSTHQTRDIDSNAGKSCTTVRDFGLASSRHWLNVSWYMGEVHSSPDGLIHRVYRMIGHKHNQNLQIYSPVHTGRLSHEICLIG